MTRRRVLKLAAGGVAGLGVATGFYTWLWEPHWVEVVRRKMPVAGLPPGLAGATLVQLGDLHIGTQVDDDYLLHCFDLVKALAPQIVVYQGDFATCVPEILSHAERMIPHVPIGRLGTFGVLGNHDYGPEWSHPKVAAKIAEFAANAGVRILRNEVADVAGLQIMGLDDLWSGRFDLSVATAALKPGAAIAVSHNPDTVDMPGWDGFSSWILCGHTHGGQCKPPFLPPPVLPVQNRTYIAGEYALSGNRRMYINRGVGHLMQVRFNARPEITVFELERI
jgi:predicted MPP superfamily phosphohydrolase